MVNKNKKSKNFKRNLFFFFLFIVLAGITFYPLDQPQGNTPKAQTANCGNPGDQGNEMGIGRYCTAGGGECQGTQSPYCSVDVVQGVPAFCSKPCETDAECGTGATCQGTGLERGCAPAACGTIQLGMGGGSPTQDPAVQTPVTQAPAAGQPNGTTISPSAGSGPAACGNPGDQGNSMGVGRYCTAGGGECRGTQSQYCAVDFQQGVPAICSKPCSTNADCGENAICSGSGLERGCEPTACGAGSPSGTQPAGGGIPGGGTLGGQLPPLDDLGNLIGGGDADGLLSILIGVIGGGGGIPGGGGGATNSCDIFDQLLSFIGLASCSAGGGGSIPNIGGVTGGGGGGGLLQTIEGAFDNLF
jgi:hypothetical protein